MATTEEFPYGAQMRRHHFTVILGSGVLAVAAGVLDMAVTPEMVFGDAGAWLIGGGIVAGVIGSSGLSVAAETRAARDRYAILAAAVVVAVSVMILVASAAVLVFFDAVFDAVGATGSLSGPDIAAITAWFVLWTAIPAAGIPSFITWRRRRLSTSVDEAPCQSSFPLG